MSRSLVVPRRARSRPEHRGGGRVHLPARSGDPRCGDAVRTLIKGVGRRRQFGIGAPIVGFLAAFVSPRPPWCGWSVRAAARIGDLRLVSHRHRCDCCRPRPDRPLATASRCPTPDCSTACSRPRRSLVLRARQQALADGYVLHGSPALTHDGERVIAAQAVVLRRAAGPVSATRHAGAPTSSGAGWARRSQFDETAGRSSCGATRTSRRNRPVSFAGGGALRLQPLGIHHADVRGAARRARRGRGLLRHAAGWPRSSTR